MQTRPAFRLMESCARNFAIRTGDFIAAREEALYGGTTILADFTFALSGLGQPALTHPHLLVNGLSHQFSNPWLVVAGLVNCAAESSYAATGFIGDEKKRDAVISVCKKLYVAASSAFMASGANVFGWAHRSSREEVATAAISLAATLLWAYGGDYFETLKQSPRGQALNTGLKSAVAQLPGGRAVNGLAARTSFDWISTGVFLASCGGVVIDGVQKHNGLLTGSGDLYALATVIWGTGQQLRAQKARCAALLASPGASCVPRSPDYP